MSHHAGKDGNVGEDIAPENEATSYRTTSPQLQQDPNQRYREPASSIDRPRPGQSPRTSRQIGNQSSSLLQCAPNYRLSWHKSLFGKNLPASPRKADITELTVHPASAASHSSKERVIHGDVRGSSTVGQRMLGRKGRFNLPPLLRLAQWWKDLYCKAEKVILRIPEALHSKDGRHIFMNEDNLLDERTGVPYINNSIRSSRYNLLNFFPRQLFAQFSKLANLYFLVIGIMQMIPGLSTTGRFTTIVPLLVFVGISMAKEGWDDIRRWRLDQEENSRLAHVLVKDHPLNASPSASDSSLSKSRSWIAKKWVDIQVGHIVRLDRDDPVPADIILLYAEGDSAYMETMALDGETSFKKKQPPATLLKSCTSLEHISSCRGEVVVEDPSIDLYRFEGKISVAGESLPLTTAEVMHRGSTLRNTQTAAGIVCYTGEECRIRQNANKNPRIKAPAMQALVNRIVILTATFVFLLSLGCAFGYKAWDSYEEKAWYLKQAGVYWGYVLTSFIIMYNTLLPLSLYVSMEIVKLVQVWLMMADIDMYDPSSGTAMQCQTSTINEELGQISYIFSDKTGTLTRNEMKVRKLSCGGYVWNHDPDWDGTDSTTGPNKTEPTTKDRSAVLRRSEDRMPLPQSSASAATDLRSSMDAPPDVQSLPAQGEAAHDEHTKRPEGYDPASLVAYVHQHPLSPMAKKARFFILSIALCHTCLPEREKRSNRTKFQATSPDELALVTAAQEMGYLVVDHQNGKITVKTYPDGEDLDPTLETYEILQVIEFTSSRKRMSVIVREPGGQICVHCKGADTVIHTLLRLSDLAAAQIASVEKQATRRRSLEAQHAFRRRSSAHSTGRPSLEPTGLSRRSSTVPRPLAGRKSVDQKPSDPLANFDEASASSTGPFSRPHSRYPSTTGCSPAQEKERPPSESRAGMTSDMPSPNEVVDDVLVTDERWVMERTFGHINHFANEGLRTLLHTARYLGEEEYLQWAKMYSEAATALSDREKRISDAANLIERQFELIGATAVEDRLQEGVPDAIDRLRRANIKLWMLTGDKRETAISISRSCSLAKDYSTITILDHTAEDVSAQISNAVLDLSRGTVAHGVLVLDGETLASIDSNAEQRGSFLELAVLMDSVICCRASPSQKALLVRSVRHQIKGAITLAIGDGANDVAMIQEADVGIGVSGGKEGLQAARTSDYAIAQFRFLCKLLLVHGRWNYDRISKYILATTYKEMVFYMTQALYQRYNGYTGTSLYENWSLSWYNAFFTSLPVIFLGAFMADLSAATLLAVPELYTKGQRREGFNFKLWLWWMFLASAEAMLVYFVMYSIFAETPFTLDNGVYAMGVLTYTVCVIIVSLKLQVLEVHNKSFLVVIAIGISLAAWFVWNLLISGVYGDNVIYNVKSGFLERFGRNALWWLTLLLTVLAFVLFELAVKSLKATFFPSDVDRFQVLERDPVLRQRFERSAAPLLHSPVNEEDLNQVPNEKNDDRPDAERRAQDEGARVK